MAQDAIWESMSKVVWYPSHRGPVFCPEPETILDRIADRKRVLPMKCKGGLHRSCMDSLFLVELLLPPTYYRASLNRRDAYL